MFSFVLFNLFTLCSLSSTALGSRMRAISVDTLNESEQEDGLPMNSVQIRAIVKPGNFLPRATNVKVTVRGAGAAEC